MTVAEVSKYTRSARMLLSLLNALLINNVLEDIVWMK